MKKYDKVHNQNLTVAQCSLRPTPTEKEEFCRNRFPTEDDVYKDCKENYCEMCCKMVIDELHPLKLHACIQKCGRRTLFDDKNHFLDICVEPPIVK